MGEFPVWQMYVSWYDTSLQQCLLKNIWSLTTKKKEKAKIISNATIHMELSVYSRRQEVAIRRLHLMLSSLLWPSKPPSPSQVQLLTSLESGDVWGSADPWVLTPVKSPSFLPPCFWSSPSHIAPCTPKTQENQYKTCLCEVVRSNDPIRDFLWCQPALLPWLIWPILFPWCIWPLTNLWW